ncbi:MAG: TonB-dependent receptor [Gammaproteobacteria bacterium]|nr:TonB-dependent receptor [Gammaproteobacteria bacterium]
MGFALVTGRAADVVAQEVDSFLPASIAAESQLVEYEADFFTRYKPSTALDMVRQLPGFQIDDGDTSRGFGGTVGNILINDKYPSAKKDKPTALLSRIPVGQVERIELIRGPVRGIDLRGQVVLANIVLRTDIPAAVQWEVNLLHSISGPDKPGINISLSDRWKAVDYNVGLDMEAAANEEYGTDSIFNAAGELTEIRYDEEQETGIRLTGLFLNASSWLGETFVQLNAKLGLIGGPEELISRRVPQAPVGPPRYVYIRDDQHNPSFELGLDAEQPLGSNLIGKAILLFTHSDLEVDSAQQNTDESGLLALDRMATFRTLTRESIARYELDWSAVPNHVLQFNIEGALTALDNSFSQTDDIGAGPVPIDVPGANSQVEELRWDLLIKDTWSLGKLELDYGIGAELSTITQTGDVELQRDFSFLKPQGALIYSPSQVQQYRLVLAREVSQLDFGDFVSATVFEDDDLALGNPDLRPETTWIAELGHERRFAADSVFTVTLFHHWIADVQDLLPLTSDFEVPGNIGDGTRWGVRFESTMPLDRLGIDDAKLDFKFRWQESSVIDPVTGNSRPLTANCCFRGPPNIKLTEENEYAYDIAFRQDFQDAKVAWGWDIAEQAERPRFKVNELEVYDEGMEVNVFVESTRWFGIKIRIEGRNLLNYTESRDRVLYAGERQLSPLDALIVRERSAARRVNVVLSGNF